MSKAWKQAQQLESQWWPTKKEVLFSQEYHSQIGERSERVEKWLHTVVEISEDCNILEIGGGATQLIDFFSKGNKYAIDPLADMYQREFSSILNPEVRWTKAKAEEIPHQDEFFTVIVSRNVLDHVDSVRKTLSEMWRVLKKNGVVYLGLNTFSGLLFVYKLIVKDKEHPFTFTPHTIKSYINDANFTIIDTIADAPENMSHFSDKIALVPRYKTIVRNLFLRVNSYHFTEFLLNKR
jgi:ubiquinone/menaquinone biosynthesis C-methylase UbiE